MIHRSAILLPVFLSLVILCSACKNCKDACYYMSLGDRALYQAATNGNKVGGCYISRGQPGNACRLYVKTAKVGSLGYRGWPRNINNVGTGCVKTPPQQNTCYYTANEYNNWPLAERQAMCQSPFGYVNALAQLRHAIKSDQCDIPCGGPCKLATYYLLMSDQQLFDAAVDGKKVGGCFVYRNTGNWACEFYVKAATAGSINPSTGTPYDGWPRNQQNQGTGCVLSSPSGSVSACFPGTQYNNWPLSEKQPMCTASVVANAAARLRHAIRYNQCGICYQRSIFRKLT